MGAHPRHSADYPGGSHAIDELQIAVVLMLFARAVADVVTVAAFFEGEVYIHLIQ